MKLLKKFMSILLTAALIVLNVPHPSLIAYAASASLKQTIPSCGLNIGADPDKRAIYTGISHHSLDYNGYATTQTTKGCFYVDKRITGSISFKATHDGTTVGTKVNEIYKHTHYPSDGDGYPEIAWTLTYTPSEADLEKGIYYGYLDYDSANNPADENNIDNAKQITGPITITGDCHLQCSTWPSSFGVLMCRDVYNFVSTGKSNYTTETLIGTTSRGPTSTSYYYNTVGNYFRIKGGTYTPQESPSTTYNETGGFVSKSVSGSIQVNSGSTFDCSEFSSATSMGNGSSGPYANIFAGCSTYYGIFFDIPVTSMNTVKFTPSAADVVNKVRIAYVNDFGKISSFTTVTSTSTITFNCKWFVIFLPGDLVEGIDNLVIKVLPTASAAEYNATLSTVSVAGGSVVNGIGEVVQGTWSWESPDTKLTSLGNKAYNATFTSA